jgi:hypothetical protein
MDEIVDVLVETTQGSKPGPWPRKAGGRVAGR